MLVTNPKSPVQKKLLDAQVACAYIRVLAGLEAHAYATHGEAIGAGIAALADQVDSEIDDVHRLLSEEVAHA